jgi:general secretion pathway protein G
MRSENTLPRSSDECIRIVSKECIILTLHMTKRRIATVSLIAVILSLVVAAVIGLNRGGNPIHPIPWVTDDLHNLGTQIEVFKEQYGRYPTTEEGLDALVHKPNDRMIAEKWVQQLLFIGPDLWGHPYQYRCPGRRNSEAFDLFSLGPDGVESADDIYFAKHGADTNTKATKGSE